MELAVLDDRDGATWRSIGRCWDGLSRLLAGVAAVISLPLLDVEVASEFVEAGVA
jgi:hypothetical protein